VPYGYGDEASKAWLWWAVGAVVSLIVVAAAVFIAGMHPALLLGWGIGMAIAAMMLAFRRGS
jgi:hypothetical protein